MFNCSFLKMEIFKIDAFNVQILVSLTGCLHMDHCVIHGYGSIMLVTPFVWFMII